MSRKYKKIIDDEYKQSRDYFRKAIEEQYQRDINKKTGTHSTLDDDIAPVKKERTWFSTGAFDDGYDFGDVTKSILGTIGDTGSNIMEGVASVGHNLAALTAGGVAEVADFIGQDDYANKVRNRLAGKDEETNEFLNKYSPKEKFSDASDFFGGNSLLGEKSDNLASSAGSLMGAMALQSVGVPGIATMGLQAAGGELENAYKSGATSKEAWTSAAVTGISEAVIERLSGGISFGAKTLDELWKEPLTKAITNRTANTFAKYGLDILGEGAEEVITEAVQSLGRLSYEDKSVREALFSEEARDNYIEAFIGGGIIGGGFSAKRAYDSVKTGRDYDTGLSANEQRVIDSEVRSRTAEKQKKAAVEAKVSQIINEREATLGTLTDAEKKNIRQNVQAQLENGQLDYSKAEIDKKELAAIEKQVREDLDRGDIGIDAIEGTLAGEKTAQINDLKAELSKTTNEAKKAEIQAKLNELTADRATQMQELLRKDVYLQESYRQEALKSQEFTREVTDKDSDITKELIESAKSVKMNDTRKMHDLFEYTNKIANDSGTKYGFVNNEQLKELGHAVEGTTINGLVRTNKDGSAKVLINVDSDKALNAIIGHETTHLLEGTGEYKTLQDIVKQYATTKGDYDVRLQSMKKLYEGVDANLENEITADLVGDYLFTDEQFIKELTADRNVFQKIYDYVKRAYKMATAGSKEKRELEKVKRSFEKAYKEISKTTTQQTKDNSATDVDSSTDPFDSEPKYSLSDLDQKTIDFLENQEHIVTYKAMQVIDGELYPPMAAKVKDENGKYQLTTPRKLGVWQQAVEDSTNIKKVKNGVGYYTLNKGDGSSIDAAYNPYEHSSNMVLNDQFESAHRRDNLVVVECVIPVSEMSSGYKAEYAKDTTGVKDWKAGVVAGKLKDNKRQVYLTRWLKPVRILSDAEVAAKYKEILDGSGVAVPFNVVQPSLLKELEKVGVEIDYEGSPMYKASQKRKAEKEAVVAYSLSDSDGRKLTKGQQEYFKNSKVRDENGNLKVMYHGTGEAGFHEFKFSDDGLSYFFTDNNAVAKSYSGTHENYAAETFRTAEDFNRFFAEIGSSEYEVQERDREFVLYEDGDEIAISDTADGIYEEFRDRTGLGAGSANYEVYLNITNPLEVDADSNNWDEIPVPWTNEIQTTREIAKYAKDHGYDGVIFTNIIDNGMYASGMERFSTSTVAIAFDSNQIKSVRNETPTGNPDIRYSLSDNEGIKLTKNQQEYFKKSVVRDESGNLLRMYHGTSNAGHTVFDPWGKAKYGLFGTGTYFTDDPEVALSYTEKGRGKNPGVYEVYLNITNPIDMDAPGNYEAWSKALPDADFPFAGTNEDFYRAMEEYFEDDGYTRLEAAETAMDVIEGMGYDGITHIGGGRFNKADETRHRVYIAFQPEQIKNFNNENPSDHPDIRYSLSGDSSVSKYSLTSWNNTDKASVLTNLTNAGYKKTDAEKWINDVNSVVAVIARSKYLDYEPDEGQTMLKNNQEYVKTLDASTLCKKRLLYQGTYNEIQHRLPNTALMPEDVLRIREMMAEKGLEVPCGICYEESRKKNEGKFAKKWLSEYDGDYKPTLEEVTTTDGRAKLKAEHPEVLEDYLKFQKTRGSANPKVTLTRTDYQGEILDLSQSDIEKIKHIGGLRVQSFSDFETPHLIDMMQAVLDMAEMKLTSQAYTKVPNFARVFGDTGIKINLSLIGQVDETGKLVFDGKEGINPEEAFEIRNQHSKHVGTILVGANKESILAGWADDRIDMVIPFHRSGWKLSELETLGLTGYRDFTRYQSERYMDGSKNGLALGKVKKNHGFEMEELYSIDYWDYSKTGKENAEEYLRLCAEQKRRPVFYNFLVDNGDGSYSLQPDGSTDGYWKSLVDFKMYDNNGVGSPQELVRPNFNMTEAYRVLEEYDENPNELPVADEIVEQFVSEYKGDHPRGKYSLSRDAAPIGTYNVYGKDVLLPEISTVEGSSVLEDVAPVNVPESQSYEEGQSPTTADFPYGDRQMDEAEPVEEENLVAKTKKELRKHLLGNNPERLTKALDDAKNIPMALMNNTDTIRNTEIVFGRENGRIINEAIFQKEINNEAKSIAWQNKERAEIKELGIKARSKESAAVQKYGEKQYVNEFGDLVKYGEDELIAEGFDVETQAKIRKAARVIREKYDNYIDQANNVLTQLGFEPIKKRNDYMRHFQELNDVFSRYGIPFNAQAMQEHVLPTDINGLTEFWSPQKNYFANMQPRKGMRTTLDAITGIDGYIGGIANLIYHTEDIQRGRAFEELIRETYGQENGWDNLEKMENLSPEEYQARADKIQDNHLSNYAAWVHEWTNNIAGKKNKVDRSIESMFGRRAFSLLDQTRKQVGANMIGFNLSSSLTNLVAPVQAAAKTNKLALAKGTADTIKNIFVKDNFTEKNSFLTARMGTDMLSKTAWEKVQDAGYVFMKGMDWFSSNQIVRSKYYELRAKGMSEEQAHAEAGKFAARIMGDRTKGAQAQLYNSKLIGLVTQFQLEVNNQLYSMFYDTYHESKENAKNNAARTAAGMTFTLGQLAALTHVFGKTFEAIAGYNPTFDIIGIIATALGAGDDDDEKTTGERLKDAADKLVDALPYVNILTGGGRIPIASGIPNPIGVMTGGKDEYGNELTWGDEAKKLLYLIPPTGGNQAKKTYQGLSMFDEDLPVSGSYTGSGNLRYPVEDTPINRAQAALFGQYASGNARDYFDNERQPLKEKQIQEYADLDIPIADYWKYREGLKDQETVEDKFDYIAGLDLPVSKKNIMINNIVDREEEVDLTNYSDFGSYEEFDFAANNPEKYSFLQANDVSYEEYNRNDVSRDAYNWAFKNQEGYTVSRAVSDVVTYRQIAGSLYDIKADKDSEGKSISGSRKEKVLDYINGLDLDYGARLILFKSEYPSYDDANMDIIDYLNNRDDISYEDMVTILTELEFTVDAEGNIYW